MSGKGDLTKAQRAELRRIAALAYERELAKASQEDGIDVLGDDGVPRLSGEAVVDGLYFCGFHVAPTGMLREIGIEAERIAGAIARQTPGRPRIGVVPSAASSRSGSRG